MREFTDDSLAEFNGKEGKPAYVARNGRVYDVSRSKFWKGGIHMRRHNAGKDLSVDFKGAPHGPEVLERVPEVGILKEKQISPKRLPENLQRLLKRYPMLNRHPHPMTVHFPIVFTFSVTIFSLLYLATGIRSFETTALHCLGASILFIPVVIVTGLFTWWHNYLGKPIKPVKIKIWSSLLLWIVSLTIFTWRIAVPNILDSSQSTGLLYLVLVIALLPIVMVIGWFGAMMTFPVHDE